MSDQSTSGTSVPEVEIRKRPGISIVWLIPLIAAGIGIWLAYTALTEGGPTVTITFATATGLEAGKTRIKYKDVDFGLVDSVTVTDDLSRIVVTATLDRHAQPHLKENTRFWVVRPRLGIGGVSGLDTLVSGAYIEIDPGDGPPRTSFVGLETPPVVRSNVPGREFRLIADSLGSLGPGSPIYYRGLNVGEVLGYELTEDNRNVLISIFVYAPHEQLIDVDTRFWNASGFDITIGADGLKVNTESVQTILAGGIAFEAPGGVKEPAAAGTLFTLYRDANSVTDRQFTPRIAYLTRFEGSVRGLQLGAPVEFRGIRIGTVTDIRADFDIASGEFNVPVTFEIDLGRLGVDTLSPDADPYETTERLVARGMRTQLISGNLLTGQLLISLEFFPDAEPAFPDRSGRYPLIPSVPSTVEQLKESVSSVLAELSNLQLPGLIADARQVLTNANRLVASPELASAMIRLESTLSRADSLMSKLDNDIAPLMESLTTSADAATGTLIQAHSTMISAEQLVGNDSELVYSLNELLRELTIASRSIRILADYLESHPEALVRGKGPEN